MCKFFSHTHSHTHTHTHTSLLQHKFSFLHSWYKLSHTLCFHCALLLHINPIIQNSPKDNFKALPVDKVKNDSVAQPIAQHLNENWKVICKKKYNHGICLPFAVC